MTQSTQKKKGGNKSKSKSPAVTNSATKSTIKPKKDIQVSKNSDTEISKEVLESKKIDHSSSLTSQESEYLSKIEESSKEKEYSPSQKLDSYDIQTTDNSKAQIKESNFHDSNKFNSISKKSIWQKIISFFTGK